ncbi:transglycosylase domain-containing protein [Streptomyces varsoviensis]|uniref:transglycosylase domain-containing protein n=1 Tax=Streptomyces varsoviensis TaxID=67373 RepID=UPI0004CA5004|nr:transglycosylase domain-containing protein [Streptomyces varsoviensis]
MGRAEARKAQKKGARRAKGRAGRNGKKGGIRRFFTWKKLLAYFVAVCALIVGGAIALYWYVDVPKGNPAAMEQSNVYKLSNGEVLARKGATNRESVPLSKIPLDVQHAFVAVENKNFYDDDGIDIKGTTRGILNTVMGRGKQGGSTITQQYVKNYYLGQEQTVTRKVKELIISLKVDREKDKNEILAGYLNTSFYGRNAYGIQAAARAYYGKDVDKLSIEEGAYLAALLQAPSQYDWAVAGPVGKKLALGRWNDSLNKMVEKGWLDKGKRDAMKFPTPIKPKPEPGLSGQTGYLVKAANDELLRSGMSEQELAGGGWTITLNIDPKKQAALKAAVKGEVLDKLDPEKRKADRDAQVGAASVDPKTGKVLALYGGSDFFKHYINNATREDFQPASTFKPIILAAALKDGAKTQDGLPINANTIYDGTSKRPVKGSTTAFAPPNEDDVNYGPVNVQKAMNNSVNSVFAQMAVDVGLGKVKQTAIDLGMNPKAGGFDVRPAMSLGVMGASPMEMAGIYATVDNHGKKVTPTIVKSATNNIGGKVEIKDPIGEQVLPREAADSLTSVLTGVVDEGTGSKVKNADHQVAGKTGTSDDNKSAWFTGYTPDLVTSVGMFGEGEGGKQVPLKGTAGKGRINGGDFPAEIWAAYTNKALSGASPSKFDLVEGSELESPPPTQTQTQTPPPTQTQTQTPPPTHTQSPPPTRTHTPPPPTHTQTTPPPTHHTPPPWTPSSPPPSQSTGEGRPGGDDGWGF